MIYPEMGGINVYCFLSVMDYYGFDIHPLCWHHAVSPVWPIVGLAIEKAIKYFLLLVLLLHYTGATSYLPQGGQCVNPIINKVLSSVCIKGCGVLTDKKPCSKFNFAVGLLSTDIPLIFLIEFGSLMSPLFGQFCIKSRHPHPGRSHDYGDGSVNSTVTLGFHCWLHFIWFPEFELSIKSS